MAKKKTKKKKQKKGKDKKKKDALKSRMSKKNLTKKKEKKKKDKKKKEKKNKDKKTAEIKAFNDHSSNYNARDALSRLRSLKSPEEVETFTRGEKRVTVTRAILPVLNRLNS